MFISLYYSCLKVVVHNQVSKNPVKLCNVVGIMPGEMTPTSTESDQYVIMGNHHDAWVQGACDPGSGMVILQEIARILGEAYRNGKIIYFCCIMHVDI